MPFKLYIQGSGTIARGKVVRVRHWGESKWNTLFWRGQHCHMSELPACLHKTCASCSQSTLYHEGGVLVGFPPLTEHLWTADGFWGRERQLSLRVWLQGIVSYLVVYLKSMTRVWSWGSKKVWVGLGGAIGRGGVNMIKTHEVLIKLIRWVLKMHNVFYTHHRLTQHVFLTQKKRLTIKEQLLPLVSTPHRFSSSSSSTQDDVLTNSIQHRE